jgi:hypothetical protein
MKIAPAKTIVLAPLLCLLFSGCAVLTDSQVKNINAFAATAKSYSAFPSAVVQQYASFNLHTQFVTVSQFRDTVNISRGLNQGRTSYARTLEIATQFDLSIQLLQQYAGLLTKLSSDSYIANLSDPTASLGENFGKLVNIYNAKAKDSFPPDIGNGISKVILLIGRQLTKHKQTAALKEFVLTCDPLVQITMRNLTTTLEGQTFKNSNGEFATLQSLLAEGRNAFITSYQKVVFSDPAKTDYNSVKFYYDELTAYATTESLRQSVVTAAKSLARSHAELAKNVQEKKELKELIAETQQLIADAKDAGAFFQELIKLR